MKHYPVVTSRGEATRVRERFERLLAAGVAIFSRHELEHVLQEVVDAARDVVGARYAALGVLGADGTSLVQFVTSGMEEAARQRGRSASPCSLVLVAFVCTRYARTRPLPWGTKGTP